MDIQKELVEEFDEEIKCTRKMLEAIPEDADFAWKANPKSMSLGRLAAHTAETGGEWARDALGTDGISFDMTDYKPWKPANKAELMEKFDKDSTDARAVLVTMEPDKWDAIWKMSAGDQVWINDSRYRVWRKWVINHMIHHRAQLGRDLRTLGAKIPGTYGPSADES